jgi:hypothetical protein
VQYFSWHPNHASLVLPLWTWAGMSCLSSIVSTSDSIHGARSRCIYIFLFSCLWCEKKIVFNSQTVSTLVTWVLWPSFFHLRRCVFDNNSSTSWKHNMLRLSYLLTPIRATTIDAIEIDWFIIWRTLRWYSTLCCIFGHVDNSMK